MITSRRHPELVSGSTSPRGSWVGRKAQSYRKIMPVGIDALDKADFPRAVPALELLFAGDSRFHFGKSLKIYQSRNAMTLGEARIAAFSVLPKPTDKVGCNADVQCAAGLAGQDVNGRFALFRHLSDAMAPWTLKQVQGDAVGVPKFSLLHSELKKAYP